MAYLEHMGLAELTVRQQGWWWRWVIVEFPAEFDGSVLAEGRLVPFRWMAVLGAWWYRKPRGVS